MNRRGLMSLLRKPAHKHIPGHNGLAETVLLEGGPLDLQDDGSRMEPLEPLPPWKGAPQPASPAGPDEGAWFGATLTDPVTPVPRRYAPVAPVPDPLTAAVYAYGWDVRDDLDDLPVFRAVVHAHLVRQDAAQGHRARGGTWQGWYARVLHERFRHAEPALPDFHLYRYDHLADEVVARALAAVDVEWAARHAAPDGEAEVAA